MQLETAKIIPFPPARTARLVREVLAAMDAFPSPYRASIYIQQIDARLRCRLGPCGLSTDETDRLISDFWRAIQPHLHTYKIEGLIA